MKQFLPVVLVFVVACARRHPTTPPPKSMFSKYGVTITNNQDGSIDAHFARFVVIYGYDSGSVGSYGQIDIKSVYHTNFDDAHNGGHIFYADEFEKKSAQDGEGK